MFRKILPIFFLLLIYYSKGNSQACTTLGQTSQTAFPVCGRATFFQTSVPTCSNNLVPVPCADGVTYVDYNPYWYKFTCYQSGTLGFLIAPEDETDDYDWQIFDITGFSPDDVYTNSSLFVTGNWSGSSGETGTSIENDNNISCASDPAANVTTFSKMPDLIEGHNYLLLISHYSGDNQSGYSLTFGGGSASIVDPVKPAMVSVKPNCSGSNIYVTFNKKLQCATLAANGSDFTIASSNSKVIAASGVNCNSGFDMDSVLITLDKDLPAGDYSVVMKNGSDSNTLLDNCDNPVPENSSISFTIVPLAPTVMDSLMPVQCAPDVLQLVFQNGIRCNSIAANGSDFAITGTDAVNITGAAGDNCINDLSYKINIKLSKPIQTAGNYKIALQTGSDGNSIIDECAEETPAGSSINFTTADTVFAVFNYRVGLGCVYDTLFYKHDGRNNVNDWNWVFDMNGTSNAPDSFFLFDDYGAKHIHLNVSNGVCTDSSSADILLDNELMSRFNVAPSSLCPEDAAQFTDSSTGKIIRWYWIFGDGTTSTMQNPPAKYYPAPPTRDGRIYPASLIVKNDIGCFDTAKKNIQVYYNCYIAVPSAFTPNGDGLNDYLYPLDAFKADNLEFRVYNRWGQLVFETKDWTKKWNGTINGNPQSQGTYVWMLQYTNHDTGKSFFLKGTTVLIR